MDSFRKKISWDLAWLNNTSTPKGHKIIIDNIEGDVTVRPPETVSEHSSVSVFTLTATFFYSEAVRFSIVCIFCVRSLAEIVIISNGSYPPK